MALLNSAVADREEGKVWTAATDGLYDEEKDHMTTNKCSRLECNFKTNAMSLKVPAEDRLPSPVPCSVPY